MSLKYYLIQCDCRNPFTIMGDREYIHIKAHVDGQQVAIISEEEIIDEYVIEKTKEELQIILDNWIDKENENPEKFLLPDGTEEEILQTKINIDIYKGNING